MRFGQPLLFFIQESCDFFGEFEEAIWVLLNRSLLAKLAPAFTTLALHGVSTPSPEYNSVNARKQQLDISDIY